MRIARAVVGWDGSAPADGALRWAADTEQRHHGAVHVVRVLDTTGRPSGEPGVAEARTALEHAVSELARSHPNLPVTAELAVGDPVEELARIGDRAALLVIGASATDRTRHPEARRVPLAVVGRSEGVTAVVPAGPHGPLSGVVAVVRGRERSAGTLRFAARAAQGLREPLTLLRIRDPFEPVDGPAPVTLAPELRMLAREFPGLALTLDPRWVRSPISLLSHSDHASLLVLEGLRPSAAPPRYSLERWLAGQARAPFVVVAEPRLEEGAPAGADERERLSFVG